jgi:hypothetical protein
MVACAIAGARPGHQCHRRACPPGAPRCACAACRRCVGGGGGGFTVPRLPRWPDAAQGLVGRRVVWRNEERIDAPRGEDGCAACREHSVSGRRCSRRGPGSKTCGRRGLSVGHVRPSVGGLGGRATRRFSVASSRDGPERAHARVQKSARGAPTWCFWPGAHAPLRGDHVVSGSGRDTSEADSTWLRGAPRAPTGACSSDRVPCRLRAGLHAPSHDHCSAGCAACPLQHDDSHVFPVGFLFSLHV